jgi:hypothetical protein
MSDQLTTTPGSALAAPKPSTLGAINAEHLIAMAIEKGADIATLERLMNIRQQLVEEAARTAYYRALSNFQGVCPVVFKERGVMNKNPSDGVRYYYATMENITRKVGPMLQEHGFSYRFEVTSDEKAVHVTCIASHCEGHSASTSFTSVVDMGGFMTLPQKFASALTYAKRYAFCNAFGIVTGDEDDDATAAGEAPKPETAKEKLARLRREKEAAKEAIEPVAETAGLHLLTDFLNGIATATDELELDTCVSQMTAMPDGKPKDTAREAIKARADHLGFVWSKQQNGFVKKGGK